MDLWIAQQYPYAEWLHSFSLEHVMINIEGDQCSSSYIPTCIHEPRPTSNFLTNTLAQALTDSPPTRTFSSLTHSDSHAKASQYRTVSESLSSPCPTLPPAQQEDLEQVLFTLEVLAPARRPLQ
ncbi:hypothetical protein C0991_005554 [Blastosporella zonata]|nr:hypothetical protein C0991_005554 [Blastosporella zonata]